jgi:hypothetical protein
VAKTNSLESRATTDRPAEKIAIPTKTVVKFGVAETLGGKENRVLLLQRRAVEDNFEEGQMKYTETTTALSISYFLIAIVMSLFLYLPSIGSVTRDVHLAPVILGIAAFGAGLKLGNGIYYF